MGKPDQFGDEFIKTNHFILRASQRSIKDKHVVEALNHGVVFQSLNCTIVCLTTAVWRELQLPRSYRGVTVVLDPSKSILITTYRHDGPLEELVRSKRTVSIENLRWEMSSGSSKVGEEL